jgi:hypothetical protein
MKSNANQILVYTLGGFLLGCFAVYLLSSRSDNTSQLKTLSAFRLSDDDPTFQHAYSLWFQPSDRKIFDALRNQIQKYGRVYSGTFHEPHATLYGAIYSQNESFVKGIALELSHILTPLTLQYNFTDVKKFNPDKRWRGGLTVRYKATKEFKAAATIAATAFHATDIQKPHTSILYDYTGKSSEHYNLPSDFERSLLVDSNIDVHKLQWEANIIHVVYTPLRQYWKNEADQRAVVGLWKKVASFPMKAVSDAV